MAAENMRGYVDAQRGESTQWGRHKGVGQIEGGKVKGRLCFEVRGRG